MMVVPPDHDVVAARLHQTPNQGLVGPVEEGDLPAVGLDLAEILEKLAPNPSEVALEPDSIAVVVPVDEQKLPFPSLEGVAHPRSDNVACMQYHLHVPFLEDLHGLDEARKVVVRVGH